MIDNGLKFVLSTHENSRPRRRTVITALVYYIIVGMVLLISGAYLYYNFFVEEININLGYFKLIPFMLLIFGFIAIILGIKNIQQHETIKVDRYGVTITKGKKKKNAAWNQIKQIKSTMTFALFYRHIVYIEMIVIETLNWKHKIKRGNFSVDELKQLFLNITDHSKNKNINIVDGLKWLPDYMEFRKEIKAGQSARIKEYKILFKIGILILLIGILIFLPVLTFDLIKSLWFILPIVLLFFGIILITAGCCGIREEKMQNI